MNKACFNDAARRYQNMVYRTALHALGSPQDAEDAVQEVFLRLFQYRGTFESEEHLRRWLLRVTVNYGRDLLKSPWRKRRVSWEETPEIPVFDRPGQAALYREVMALPEKYRTVLDLFYYEERPGDRDAAGGGGLHGDHPAGPGPEAAERTFGGGLAG